MLNWNNLKKTAPATSAAAYPVHGFRPGDVVEYVGDGVEAEGFGLSFPRPGSRVVVSADLGGTAFAGTSGGRRIKWIRAFHGGTGALLWRAV